MDNDTVEVGQVWRREGSQHLYEVMEIAPGAGSNIRLQKQPWARNSWISEAGLRSKFELWQRAIAG